MLALGFQDPNSMVYKAAIHLIAERDYCYIAVAKCLAGSAQKVYSKAYAKVCSKPFCVEVKNQ